MALSDLGCLEVQDFTAAKETEAGTGRALLPI